MKRKAALTAVILAMILLLTQTAFAGTLEITNTIPEDGESGKQTSNVAVKIVFNMAMDNEDYDSWNHNLITITDPEGRLQAFTIVHHKKYTEELWCVLTGDDLTADAEYTVKIDAGIKSADGTTLAEGKTFTFKTRNTKTDNTISLLMSLGLMVVMIFATTKATKKAMEDGKDGKKNVESSMEKVAQANPYRLAKEQGISVDEAKELIAKEQAKINRKNAGAARALEKIEAKEAAREAEIERRLQEIHDASVYKVKSCGSLKKHGKTLPKALQKKFASRKKKASGR